MSRPHDSRSTRLQNPGRRKLLQAGAAGVTAALGSGVVSLAAREQQAQAPPAAPPGPPSAAGVLDPASLPAETWCEAWVWRPADWPGQSLELNVVERNEPTKAPSLGQIFPGQFSFGGISPAPTIRVRSGGRIRVRLRNLLGVNYGQMWVGPCPDPLSITPAKALELQALVAKAAGKPVPKELDPAFNPLEYLDELGQLIGVQFMEGHCMPHVSNSEHGSRVTNIHTHGLHVTPGVNAGRGTESDNVQVRLLSKDDWALRKKMGGAACGTLAPHEHVGHVDYEFVLGRVQRLAMLRAGRPPQPDPPGTHWYHPHAHGSTHDQVSAGMAGFLIVEGDVDDAVNTAMTGDAHPDPSLATGKYDYRERLVFIQRVVVPSVDFNAPGSRRQRQNPAPVPPAGIPEPTVMFMRPGAVERWRVLNGSVDGRGFKRFMVLNGQFTFKDNALWRVEKGEGDPPSRKLVAVTRAEIEAAKLPLYQLAFDGITLVTVENGRVRHTIKDLSRRNPGTVNPLTRPPAAGENVEEATLRNMEACFRDGASLRNAFVRPNEVWMATANRADVFFKAPLDAAGKVFTVLAQEEILHTDNFQARQQRRTLGRPGFGPANPSPLDVVVAHVHVRGAAVEGGDFDVMSLRDQLPAVPPYLQPIADSETRMSATEALIRKVPAGSHRTRVMSYSGYGSAGFPLIEVPEAFVNAHPELRHLRWADHDGTWVLLAPNARTMAINNQFDLATTPNPSPPQKFSANHPKRFRMLVNTAEEWVLYNPTPTLWGHTDLERFPQKGQMLAQFRSYPVRRREAQARFWRDKEFRIVAQGADHPFHIHINPMWVTRIEVPDEQGNLHNLLDEPRWMDTVSVPRNGGRVVFRSRFADYTGRWIHHCHILMHEDMGMMQEVECVAAAAASNATPKAAVAGHAMTEAEVNAIYPRPSLELGYRQSLSFDDPNPGTGQSFPGFELEVPILKD